MESVSTKWLCLLELVYTSHRESFSRILPMDYIYDSPYDARDPRNISGSQFWVENNLSSPQKAIVLFNIYLKLGYTDTSIVQNLKYLIR